MSSKAFTHDSFLNPNPLPATEAARNGQPNSRNPNVYDAVAGVISVAGYIPRETIYASTRDTASSSASAIPPETVLYRSKNAPARYAEFDVYFANERRSVTTLPGSDLLKCLHYYSSSFYSRSHQDGGVDDWRSLDETALIAVGVLLEEASLGILGNAGDLVFTEGEKLPNEHLSTKIERHKSGERHVKRRKF